MLFSIFPTSFERIICIPTCAEFLYAPQAIESLARLPYRKLLLINNNCRTDASMETKEDNHLLHQWLLEYPHENIEMCGFSNAYRIEYSPTLTIVLLDHSHEPFFYGAKQGVGLARGQLSTIASQLIHAGIVTCPWMWCTDGDVRFAQDYLEIPPDDCGTAIVPYFHTPAPIELQKYEVGMRYYSLGLQWAHFPTPFPTIGSTIIIKSDVYNRIYGFPDRMAAEDFYLLNKAYKMAPLRYLDREPIEIVGRPSERVPFGTGQAMKTIAENDGKLDTYHPQIFRELQTWMQIIHHSTDADLIENLSKHIPDYPNLSKFAKVLQQKANPQNILKRRLEFFDCFQALRFIHHLRDTRYPNIPIEDALDIAPFVQNTHTTDWNTTQSAMFHEEKRLCGLYKL